MTSLASPTTDGALAEAIGTKLQAAPGPLKLAEVVKGLGKQPKGVKPAAFKDQVQQLLKEEVRLGRVFSYNSGKNDEARYWAKDEKQILRDQAVEYATTPLPMSTLRTKLSKEVKGTSNEFIEAVVRELIGDDRLFEYPPKTAKGAAHFGASAPPPPLPVLEQAKHTAALNKLIASCQKLLATAKVPAEELFAVLRLRMSGPDTQSAEGSMAAEDRRAVHPRAVQHTTAAIDSAASTTVEDLIMKAVENEPVLSLAELRGEMPREFKGTVFDEAVLRLADEQRVVINVDADPLRFTEAERAAFVQDGKTVFTTIMSRN